ncbi:MAG: outer membrane beta-barrel protein [Salinivirgaceae bacterium]|nr:outer membrane beta-barrel protein [Salinivirgaceae bacterium]
MSKPTKLNITILIVALPIFLMGQSSKYDKYFSKDQLSLSANSTQWIQEEKRASPSILSRGVNLQMMYPIIGNKSNVALALGFGLASQNYYLKEYISTNDDSLWFVPIPDSINYTKYKLNTNYLTIPFELRFRTNPSKATRRSFKIYPGFRVGMMINVHTKYIGRDLETDEKIKEKSFDIKHLSKFDYGASLRIGYGKFMVHGYYSFVDLIEPGKGPKLTPIEIGINIILF